VKLTALVFSEGYHFGKLRLICVYLRIEAAVFVERDGESSGTRIHRAPICNTLASVDLWNDIFKMMLPEELYGRTLQTR
jgi:hypothetical protein